MSSSNTQSESSISATTNSSNTLTISLPSHITHLISIKLDLTNFLIWQSQFLPILRLHDLNGIVNGTSTPPPVILTTGTGTNLTTNPNPAFVKWHKLNQLTLSWINSSLSDTVLGETIGITTSNTAWSTLERPYAYLSQARIMQLKY
ncbi:hypothetical protein GIB67_018367 [Kingdonia uniflora]|uniref:Retrotransposon Copia-like N-terminal domain-containing protein n=1 Tax=Kingdonia uniflora TaxID=39325 RepID=A0A7J7MJF3_9MAGN|nr:hypothetical protein GIB67_018367 [Kingdonia uniflora]